MHSPEMNSFRGYINIVDRRAQSLTTGRYSEDSAAGRFQSMRAHSSPGVEHIRAATFDSRDSISRSRFAGVTRRGQDHANGRTRLPAKVRASQIPGGSSQESLAEIAIQPVHQRLRLRISQ